MYDRYLKYFVCIIFLFILFTQGNTSPSVVNGLQKQNQPTLAILPFINHTLNSAGYTNVMDKLYLALDSNEIKYLSHTDIRPILRKHRIRSTGSISQADVSKLVNSMDIDRIMIGSINIYEPRVNPEISISIRILDVQNMNIIAASSQSAKGHDFEKLFGVGKIESMDLLVDKIIKKILNDLVFSLKEQSAQKNQNSLLKVALIPFDNITDSRKAGVIAFNILLSSLINKGYNVIEPGIVENIMSKNRRILRGEVDFATLNQLRDELQIDLLITGSIETYKTSRGASQAELELGTRTLDASNNKIMIMFNDRRKGNDSQSVFGLGKINAMGNLLQESFKKYLQTLEKKSEKYFAKQN